MFHHEDKALRDKQRVRGPGFHTLLLEIIKKALNTASCSLRKRKS